MNSICLTMRPDVTPFGWDEFCATWRLFDLLPEGPDGWRPKKSYG